MHVPVLSRLAPSTAPSRDVHHHEPSSENGAFSRNPLPSKPTERTTRHLGYHGSVADWYWMRRFHLARTWLGCRGSGSVLHVGVGGNLATTVDHAHELGKD